MPTVLKKEQRCPSCGKIHQITMYPLIVADEQPELKKRVLCEDLFDFTCSGCGYNADLAYPVFYHDKDARYMIYIAADGSYTAVQKLSPEISGVTKRTVANLKELKEKVLILESGLNDVAVEIVKLAILNIISRKYNDNGATVYFRGADEDSLSFAVYFSDNQNAVYQSANINLYKQAVDMLKSCGYKNENRFLKVDRLFAQELVAKCKKN